MIKKILIMGTVLSSCLLTQPSYSMWCCGDEEEEKLIAKPSAISSSPSLQVSPSFQVSVEQYCQQAVVPVSSGAPKTRTPNPASPASPTTQPSPVKPVDIDQILVPQALLQNQEQRGPKPDKRNPQHPSSSSPIKPEFMVAIDELNDTQPAHHVITQGKMCIEIPKKLSIISQNQNSTFLKFKDVFFVKIFADYHVALGNDLDVQGLDKVELVLKNKSSLTGRMGIFYKDIRQKMGEEDKQIGENMITCLRAVVDTFPETGPFPVKMAVDQTTTSCAILFKINEGAFLIKGPGKKQ